ncbi:hypothetical protein [Cryobacterium arcticum]|uniref:Uncharacterized protein n=1 Tax=Cryobacterium arcticum TaxID=670052 RepID=A0A1B1BQI2_9MICO|nr:hypothetical protein [Cryobacterium arcticum]ANP74877.1 hypothetical protein PA27867_3970 [Cryobacterium arcticum]
MNDSYTTPDEAAARARAILETDVETRVEAVRVAANAALGYDAAEARLKEAAAAYERSWNAARTAGWTERDLRAAGVRAPNQSTPRTRKPRTTTAASTPKTEG